MSSDGKIHGLRAGIDHLPAYLYLLPFHPISDFQAKGEREFAAVAVAGGPEGREPDGFCPPCGVCRQALAEFCAGEMPVILVKSLEETEVYRLEELFPLAFSMR